MAATFQRGARIFVLILLALLLVRGLLLLGFTFTWPRSLSPDAALMEFDAWSILQGKVAYRDFYTINLPATHALHMLGIKVFGTGDSGIRLLNGAVMLVLITVTVLYMRRLSWLSALGAASLMLLLTVDMGTFGQLQRETCMMPLWIGMLWLSEAVHDRAIGRFAGWAIIGVLNAAACLIKPQSLVFVLLLAAYWLAAEIRSGRGWRELLTRSILLPGVCLAAAMAAGLLIPAMFPAYGSDYLAHYYVYFQMFAASRNPDPSFFLSLVQQPFTFQPQEILTAFGEPVLRSGRMLVGSFTLLNTGCLVLYVILSVRDKKHFAVVCLVAAGYVSFLLQRRGYSYHLIPMWCGFHLAAGAVIGRLAGSVRRSAWGTAAAVVITLLFAARHVRAEQVLRDQGFGHLLRLSNPRDFETVTQIGAIAERLRKDRPGQNVCIQTIEFQAIAISSVLKFGLCPASSFMQGEPLYGNYAQRDANRAVFLEELDRTKPDIIAVEGRDLSEKLDPFPELARILHEKYSLAPRGTEPYWIFVRK